MLRHRRDELIFRQFRRGDPCLGGLFLPHERLRRHLQLPEQCLQLRRRIGRLQIFDDLGLDALVAQQGQRLARGVAARVVINADRHRLSPSAGHLTPVSSLASEINMPPHSRRSAALHDRGIAMTRWLEHPLLRLLELGTAGYPQRIRRRLKILNALAILIVLSSGIYALSYATTDAHTYRWIIAINLGLIAMAVCVPLLHRVSEILGGLVIAGTECAALFALVALLGHDS